MILRLFLRTSSQNAKLNCSMAINQSKLILIGILDEIKLNAKHLELLIRGKERSQKTRL
jgi:hypothetical protein